MGNGEFRKSVVRIVDGTLGTALRHFGFALVRPYYSLFFNVSCSHKEKLQDLSGAIVLSNHVSRHDPPLILSALYSVSRIRPTAYYKEYEHWAQHPFMVLFGTIPMSSPKSWEPERREAQKLKTLEIMRKVLSNGNSILIFPAGSIRKDKKEEIPAYLTGAYDTIRAYPDNPVVLIKVDGLGKYQYRKYDRFWSFIGRTNGRRHVKLDIEVVTNFATIESCAELNRKLEDYYNGTPAGELGFETMGDLQA